MHILSILLSCLALFIAIEVIRQTILAYADRILEALSGAASAPCESTGVIVPFPARSRVLTQTANAGRLAA